MEELEEYITLVIKGVCTNPEEFELYSEKEDDGYHINVKVARADIPACIGYQGLTADAIRRLANIYAKNHQLEHKVFVRVDAPKLPNNHFYE